MEVAGIKPPSHYGWLKRSLFERGVKAYQNPAGTQRKLYDVSADMAGSVLTAFNPYYDWGGIRREVQIALKQEDGRVGLNSSERTMTEDEIKRGFHPKFTTEPFNPQRFNSAWFNLKHLLARTGVVARNVTLFGSALAAGSALILPLDSFKEDLSGPIAVILFALSSSRFTFQMVSTPQKMLEPLVNYLGSLDPETLAARIQDDFLIAVDKRNLQREFWSHGIRDERYAVLGRIRVRG